MNSRVGSRHAAVIRDSIAEATADLLKDEDREVVRAFVVRYLAGVDPAQLEERSVEVIAGLVAEHWQLGAEAPSPIAVRIVATDRGRFAVLCVMDDVPFLVDSLRAVLTAHELAIHLTVHPMIDVRRDAAGRIVDVGGHDGVVEAWTLVEFDPCSGAELTSVLTDVEAVLHDVAVIDADREPMRQRTRALAEQVRATGDPDAESDAAFFGWLTRMRFVFLGAARYTIEDGEMRFVPGSGLGLLSRPHLADPPLLPGTGALAICRTDAHSRVHRPERMTCISLRTFAPDGSVTQVDRLVGLFASAAYRESATETPLLRDKADHVLRRAGYPADSHAGRALRGVLESLPRDELFEIDRDELYDLATGIAQLEERHVVRAFSVVEPGGRHVLCLVYLPRTRFTNEIAEEIADEVRAAYDGAEREYETHVGTSALARIDVTVRRRGEQLPEPDMAALERRLDDLSTGWHERVRLLVEESVGPEEAGQILRRFGEGIPAAYQAVTDPAEAVEDLVLMASLRDHGEQRTALQSRSESGDRDLRFTLYRCGEPTTLSAVLPYLEHLGVEVLDQQPFEFVADGSAPVWVSEIGIRLPAHVALDSRIAGEFQTTFAALFTGELENDGFNRLVVLAGLSGRQIAVLRAYARYLRQVAFAYSQGSIERMLSAWPHFAALLVELFEARFDPRLEGDRDERQAAVTQDALDALDAVPSLDEDRIGRALLGLIEATTRTNAFQRRPDGSRPAVLSFKFDPSRVADLPAPRPKHEIFVYSPRVEGVHLRGGKVARGGLRWSDRQEDFRTEVLGLMKAQMVKNAVIVPVGAKGGFVVKRTPADPEERRAEVEACYRRFVAGLLDVTDNIVDGQVAHPADTVCHDGDDPYLVVAADKGTATFSDVANEISAQYGYWLGDAFASGGRTGYDHKVMGITARGAWESVRRHAATLGLDADRDPITVVGIGDMSGDVFGNGMLQSDRLRLVAAFDHRHVFVDPAPDPQRSYAERKRLFELPRSSWDDYDRSLISAGGGVFSRTAKSVRTTPEIRQALGIEAESLTPNQLISAVLRAPVDLLWNGGIGTYVKASTETHLAVGDRSNDGVRVDADQLRCRMVGEGGNLGFTQLARVEYALAGGLINTDAIDNSAGVDCSDHEVNLKILLDDAVSAGRIDGEERNGLLAAMAEDVAELVLDDNRAQTRALGVARTQAPDMIGVHSRYLAQLEHEGWIDRRLEFLPSDKQLAERQTAGLGLTVPEMAVMFAHTKLANILEVVESSLPDDPYLSADLHAYFPDDVRTRFTAEIDRHRLRREIVTTALVNQMVNFSGTSFAYRMSEETGATSADVLRAWIAVRDIFDAHGMWDSLEAVSEQVDQDAQMAAFRDARATVERGVMWLLRRRPSPLDLAEVVGTFRPGVQLLLDEFAPLVRGPLAEQTQELAADRRAAGFPDDLAWRTAVWPLMHTAFDIVELATQHVIAPQDAARVYWGLFDGLEITWLWNAVGALPRVDRWQTHARAAVRDDLQAVLAQLVGSVLSAGGDVQAWMAENLRSVERATEVFADIRRHREADLTAVTVALRQLRNVVLATAGRA